MSAYREPAKEKPYWQRQLEIFVSQNSKEIKFYKTWLNAKTAFGEPLGLLFVCLFVSTLFTINISYAWFSDVTLISISAFVLTALIFAAGVTFVASILFVCEEISKRLENRALRKRQEGRKSLKQRLNDVRRIYQNYLWHLEMAKNEEAEQQH